MISLWTAGLKPTDAKKIENKVRNSKEVLDKLQELCYNRLSEIKRTSLKDYANPSWSHRAAHKAGMQEAFEYIISLTTLDQRDKE